MKYKLNRIPYYLMKIILTPFGLSNIAVYWEEKQTYKKVLKHLHWSEVDYNNYNTPIAKVIPNNTIWIYWKQGFEKAPAIVKKCQESALKYKGVRSIVFLTESNLHDYVTLPDFIEEKHNAGIISEAHYSDIVRIQLLIQYGGVWMDATCYNTNPLPECIDNADFFMFSTANWWPWLHNPSKCSNWFIKSNKNNALLCKLRNFLFEHWKHRNTPIHYYVFHFALSNLVDSDKECQKIWRMVPFISNLQPHYFMYNFATEYDKTTYDYALSQCFIHKCTYKYNSDLLKSKQLNYLQFFLNSLNE